MTRNASQISSRSTPSTSSSTSVLLGFVEHLVEQPRVDLERRPPPTPAFSSEHPAAFDADRAGPARRARSAAAPSALAASCGWFSPTAAVRGDTPAGNLPWYTSGSALYAATTSGSRDTASASSVRTAAPGQDRCRAISPRPPAGLGTSNCGATAGPGQHHRRVVVRVLGAVGEHDAAAHAVAEHDAVEIGVVGGGDVDEGAEVVGVFRTAA